jgi:hypothetical protein
MGGAGAGGPAPDRADVERLDRRARNGIEAQLAAARPASEGVITVEDLAEVLYLVLAAGLEQGTETYADLTHRWVGLAPHVEGVLERRVFDFESYMVGAYATAVGVGVALDGEPRERVQEAFLEEVTSIINRVRKRTPGGRSVRWHLRRYREEVGADDTALAPSYLAVGETFAALSAEHAGGDLADARWAVARAGLDHFYRSLSGTIRAVTSWELT